MDFVPLAARLAIQHAAASSGRRISPQAFFDALSGRDGGEDANEAVRAFLDETDAAQIADLVASRVTTFVALAALAKRLLPEFHANRALLEQLAPRTES